jgi:hypothetical protein
MVKMIIKTVQQQGLQIISLVMLKMELGMKMEMKVIVIMKMKMINVGFALFLIVMKIIP